MPAPDDPLDRLVAAVLASPKYRRVAPDLVRDVAVRELAKRRAWKDALKATKAALHQATGAYAATRDRYDRWLADLAAARARGDAAFRDACREIMAHHASTRERLPVLGEFYATALAGLPPPRRVVDVACGLDPLALPWLPLAPDAEYVAYDVDGDLIAFVDAFLALVPVRGRAEVRDVVRHPPADEADLALVLKALPCLDQLDPAAGARLLDTLAARFVLVSFPVRSLGGREKGMAATYEARFAALVADRGWSVRRHRFATELAFLVDKGVGA